MLHLVQRGLGGANHRTAVHWLLIGRMLHLVQRGGEGLGGANHRTAVAVRF